MFLLSCEDLDLIMRIIKGSATFHFTRLQGRGAATLCRESTGSSWYRPYCGEIPFVVKHVEGLRLICSLMLGVPLWRPAKFFTDEGKRARKSLICSDLELTRHSVYRVEGKLLKASIIHDFLGGLNGSTHPKCGIMPDHVELVAHLVVGHPATPSGTRVCGHALHALLIII